MTAIACPPPILTACLPTPSESAAAAAAPSARRSGPAAIAHWGACILAVCRPLSGAAGARLGGPPRAAGVGQVRGQVGQRRARVRLGSKQRECLAARRTGFTKYVGCNWVWAPKQRHAWVGNSREEGTRLRSTSY